MSITELIEKYKPGESEVKEYLRAAGYIVEDVSDNPQYWDKDIDLIVTNPSTNKRVSIEVKYDTRIYRTKNFFIEVANIRSKEGKGWFHFCEADYIYYLDAQNMYVYIFKFTELEDYINEYGARLELKSTNDGSWGYLLPLKDAPVFQSFRL